MIAATRKNVSSEVVKNKEGKGEHLLADGVAVWPAGIEREAAFRDQLPGRVGTRPFIRRLLPSSGANAQRQNQYQRQGRKCDDPGSTSPHLLPRLLARFTGRGTCSCRHWTCPKSRWGVSGVGVWKFLREVLTANSDVT